MMTLEDVIAECETLMTDLEDKVEAAQRQPGQKSPGGPPKVKTAEHLSEKLKKPIQTFEEMIRQKAEEAQDSPQKRKEDKLAGPVMTPAQARQRFGGKPHTPPEEATSAVSPDRSTAIPASESYTLEKSVSSYVSEFVAKTKAIGNSAATKSKSNKHVAKASWPPPPESSRHSGRPSAEPAAVASSAPDSPKSLKPKKASRSQKEKGHKKEHKKGRGRPKHDDVGFSYPAASSMAMSSLTDFDTKYRMADLAARPIEYDSVSVSTAPQGQLLGTRSIFDEVDPFESATIPLSPSAHRAEIAGVKAFLESQLQSLRETLEVDAHAVELQLQEEDRPALAPEDDVHNPTPSRVRVADAQAPRAQVEAPGAGDALRLLRRRVPESGVMAVREPALTVRADDYQSPQSPEFQSPRSGGQISPPKSPQRGGQQPPPSGNALTELRKVAENSVARARELELACRELAERDKLVAELQERLDTVRNEYRGEVMQLREDLAAVKQHLDATRSEKTVMEEEFLQELARLEAERAELIGAKHFLEEQVAIVERDAATSTAKGLEHLDQCSRYEAQEKDAATSTA